VSTNNSVGMKKVAKSDGCDRDDTVKEKTTSHCSREIQNGRLMIYSHWSLVFFSASCLLSNLI